MAKKDKHSLCVWTTFVGSKDEAKDFVKEFNQLLDRKAFTKERSGIGSAWIMQGCVSKKEYKKYNLQEDWILTD